MNRATFIKAFVCVMLVTGFGAQAADDNVDPTGTWSWGRPGRDGQPEMVSKLTLKVEGEKLTGKMVSPGRRGGDPWESEIQKGKISGNEISFVVIREFNNNKMTVKYMGKVNGDEIKGKMEFERNGESRSRDWVAKRVKNKK